MTKQQTILLLLMVSCGNTQGGWVQTGSISNSPPATSTPLPQPSTSSPTIPLPQPSTSSPIPAKNYENPCSYADNSCKESCQNQDPLSECVYTCQCMSNKEMECEVVCPSGKCPPRSLPNFNCNSTKEVYCDYPLASCVCDLKGTGQWQCIF
jgi:hypothetical protein